MSRRNDNILLEQQEGGGILSALATQFAAFLGGWSMGKLYRNIKGFFSGASARADAFAEDPIAQVLYQNYVSRAYRAARNARSPRQVNKAFEYLIEGAQLMDEFFDAYIVSIQRMVDAVSRSEGTQVSDYSWSPGEVKGAPGSKLLAFLGTDMREYDKFPEPYLMAEEIMPTAGATLVKGALAMIATNYASILANEGIRNAYLQGIDDLIEKLSEFHGMKYGVKSGFTALRDSMYAQDVSLNEFLPLVNRKSDGGLNMLRTFIESVDSEAVAFQEAIDQGALEQQEAQQAGETGEDEATEQEVDDLFNQFDDIVSNIPPMSDTVVFENFERELMKRIAVEMKRVAGGRPIVLEADLEEASSLGGGNIAGYSLPLGVSNQEDPDKEMEDHIEKSGWSRLPISDEDVTPDEKKKFKERGEEFLHYR